MSAGTRFWSSARPSFPECLLACPISPAGIDHDHLTDAVRGLLCVSCNKMESQYQASGEDRTGQ
ncbi:endonuclease domain-containing protein [Streptomyces sp. NPDC054901]